jgi:hypothetical protein
MTADSLTLPGFTQALTQTPNSKQAEKQKRFFFNLEEFIRVELFMLLSKKVKFPVL